MFKVGENEKISFHAKEVEKSYVIQKDDFLKIEVFTNKGERIIDPNFELIEKQQTSTLLKRDFEYLVQEDGMVKFPVVGEVKLEGLTLHEADSLLEKRYSEFYKDPFVITSYTNKRVIVLGATGGKLIPLKNENSDIIEIIALAGGIPNEGKSHNIRLIRGDLKNPEVQIIDLSTIEGMRKASLKAEPGDIIYIEPVRKPIVELTREYGPILSMLLNIMTIVVVIQNLNN